MEDKTTTMSNPPPYSPQEQPQPQAAGVATPLLVQPVVAVPVVVQQPMGPKPATIVCKSCNAPIVTRVDKKTTTKTHLFALLFCLIGFWPCVCIPYCMDSCNNADHYCPNCNAYIGSYSH